MEYGIFTRQGAKKLVEYKVNKVSQKQNCSSL